MEEQNCSIVVSRHLIALLVVIWSSEKHELHIRKALQTVIQGKFPHSYFRLYFAEIKNIEDKGNLSCSHHFRSHFFFLNEKKTNSRLRCSQQVSSKNSQVESMNSTFGKLSVHSGTQTIFPYFCLKLCSVEIKNCKRIKKD